jgi:hypothetical protein
MPQEREADRLVFDKPGQPLDAKARLMFDRADVQQRLSSLERAVDGLGMVLKPEVAELRQELNQIRGLLEDVLVKLRSQGSETSQQRIA